MSSYAFEPKSESGCYISEIAAIENFCLPACDPGDPPNVLPPEPPITVIPTPLLPPMDSGCFPIEVTAQAEVAQGHYESSLLMSSGSAVMSSGSAVYEDYFVPGDPELDVELSYQNGDYCRPSMNFNMKVPTTAPASGSESYPACVVLDDAANIVEDVEDGEGNQYDIKGRIEKESEGVVMLYRADTNTGELEEYKTVTATSRVCAQHIECGTAMLGANGKWTFIPDLIPRLALTKTGIAHGNTGPVWFIDEDDGTTKIGPYDDLDNLETIEAENRGDYVPGNTLIWLYKDDECSFFFLAYS